MAKIIFRHYKKGDEKQLSELFNLAFKRKVIERTPIGWQWRYIRSPGFEPEMCKVAEDVDKKKIVGSILVNLIEKIPIGHEEYLVGDINDVATHPSYTNRGIAKRLMEHSIKYMREKKCDFSLLNTGIKGFARSRLYQKLGYKDIEKQHYFIQIPYIPHFIKNIFGFCLFIPAFFAISHIPRYLNRLRIKSITFFKDFSYEIHDNDEHIKYMDSTNRISPKIYEGYPKYDITKFNWLRVNVPTDQQKPTYVFVRKNEKIIGGSLITHQKLNFFKSKLMIKFGIIHEIFLDNSIFNNTHNLLFGYIYLIDKIMRAATHRKLGLLLYISSFKNLTLNQAFKKMHFFKILNDIIMVKELKKDLKFPKLNKPLYVPTYVSLGF
ncbi:MAG: GNAT family N-acetyltransferase [Candidatus Thorarchaeota archaeon]